MKHLLLALLLVALPAQATNAPFLAWYAQDQQGKAMPGAKLYFYGAGTAVAKNVYSDETCAVSLGSSLTADGAGRFRRFYMGALNDCSSPLLYKVVFKTAGGSTVWTEDNVASQKTNLAGIINATSNSATAAVTGTNTSTGIGIKAVTSSGTNHALWCESDTSLPVSSAIHIVPQDNTPSILSEGDLWFDSVTGRILIYDGAEASQLMFSAKAACSATTAAGNGLNCTGNTTGNGVSGTGGATSGAGIYGTGGAPNGNGGTFLGDGTGYGILSTGGHVSGTGVYGIGVGTGNGVHGSCSGGVCNAGVYGVGPTGVWGASGVVGGYFSATGTGVGIQAYAATTGPGATIQCDGGYALVLTGDLTSPVRAALHLVPQDARPSSPTEGSIYYNSTTHQLEVYNHADWGRIANVPSEENLVAGACTAATWHVDSGGATRELCRCNDAGTAYDCISVTTAAGPTD